MTIGQRLASAGVAAQVCQDKVRFTEVCPEQSRPAEVRIAQVRSNGWRFFAPLVPPLDAIMHKHTDVLLIRHTHTSNPSGTTLAAGTKRTSEAGSPVDVPLLLSVSHTRLAVSPVGKAQYQ